MKKQFLTITFIGALILVFGTFASYIRADVINELKDKISTKTSEIEALEKEIEGYQQELVTVGNQKQTLTSEIRSIDLVRRKLEADIKVTQSKIFQTELEIEKLSLEIGDKRESILKNQDVMRDTIRKINEIDDNTLVELALSNRNISTFWDDIETFRRFNQSVNETVRELQALKDNLEIDKTEVEKEKAKLLDLKDTLEDQKVLQDQNARRKNTLLAQTKNQESTYKKLIAEKEELKKQFEQELFNYESELRVAIDPSSLPPAGSGVLAWPLEKVFITQKFGDTAFAKSGAYNGKGHNGIDLRASLGTKVKASGSGTVIGAGNTDQYPGCYSYGKWVLVKHNNGLSTLYAHLDLIKVSTGDRIVVGDTVGYSGNTGYSTGPHLHFSVYATQGVQVIRLSDIPGRPKTKCSNAWIPVAPLNAYLNPLDYL